jgi:hypothetical protein
LELEPHPIEEVRNDLHEVSRQWADALARVKSYVENELPTFGRETRITRSASPRCHEQEPGIL